MIDLNPHNIAKRRRLPTRSEHMDELKHSDNLVQRLTGLFGARGWPEMAVETAEDTVQRLPVADEQAGVVGDARKYLAAKGLEPLMP